LKNAEWKAAKSLESQLKPLFQKQPAMYWRNPDQIGLSVLSSLSCHVTPIISTPIDSKFAQADSFVNFVLKQQRLGNHGKLVIKSSLLDKVAQAPSGTLHDLPC
jgi:hypothetical protein